MMLLPAALMLPLSMLTVMLRMVNRLGRSGILNVDAPPFASGRLVTSAVFAPRSAWRELSLLMPHSKLRPQWELEGLSTSLPRKDDGESVGVVFSLRRPDPALCGLVEAPRSGLAVSLVPECPSLPASPQSWLAQAASTQLCCGISATLKPPVKDITKAHTLPLIQILTLKPHDADESDSDADCRPCPESATTEWDCHPGSVKVLWP